MASPTRRGARRSPGIALLLAVVSLALPACSKKHAAAKPKPSPSRTVSPAPSPTPTPAAVHADFQSPGAEAIDSLDRASAAAVANDAAKKVIGLVNSYYDVAFLDPSRWAGGSHPDLAGLFTDDAKPSVAANLQALALGNVAGQLSRVQPNQQVAGVVHVQIEPNLSASYAVVSTHLDATGQASAAAAQPVHIVHDIQVMVDVGAGRILAYDAVTAENSVAKSASYLPPDSPALAALGGS